MGRLKVGISHGLTLICYNSAIIRSATGLGESKMADSSRQLKDFIYLDIDRIRSFVAQLYEGVPEVFEETKGHEQAGGGKAEVNIPMLAKLGAEGNILFQKSTSETRSAHHYLYSLFEQKLRELDKLLTVDENFEADKWTPDRFEDGIFVLVEGRVQIIDYHSVVSVLQVMPQIAGIAARFQKQELQKKLQEGKTNQHQYSRDLKSIEIPASFKKDISDIGKVVNDLYLGISRAKIFPFPGNSQSYFVGNVTRDYFSTASTANPLTSYGLLSGLNWFVMGLVNKPTPPISPGAPVIGTQNLEDVLEQLVFAMQEIGKFTLAVEFPAISIVPVAIYRAC